jgi:hypothetical protein
MSLRTPELAKGSRSVEAAAVAGTKPEWLVVGHGSVGSFLTERLLLNGQRVAVCDPKPRMVIEGARSLRDLREIRRFDYCVSCVRPEAAESVARRIADVIPADALFFEWNTLTPGTKEKIADIVPAATIDVALMDSVDAASAKPTLLISGPEIDRAREILVSQGFDVLIAGTSVGEAAKLKHLRSIFMKALEALVLTYSSLASEVDGELLVRTSLENTLGQRFVAFMDTLIVTNRIHADRRSREFANALVIFDPKSDTDLLRAALDVLRRAADVWSDPCAPPTDAETDALARHLRKCL